MERHDLDPIALVFGAIFTMLGVLFAIGEWEWWTVDGAWALAGLLVALGLAGVLTAAHHARDAKATRDPQP